MERRPKTTRIYLTERLKTTCRKTQIKTSDVSFQEEADEEIDATDKEEEWIDFIKRSTEEAGEHMKKHKLPCWIEVHKRTKWRMARRIITLPQSR